MRVMVRKFMIDLYIEIRSPSRTTFSPNLCSISCVRHSVSGKGVRYKGRN